MAAVTRRLTRCTSIDAPSYFRWDGHIDLLGVKWTIKTHGMGYVQAFVVAGSSHENVLAVFVAILAASTIWVQHLLIVRLRNRTVRNSDSLVSGR